MRGFLCPNATDAFSRINARSPRRVRIACAGRYSFTTSICLLITCPGEAIDCKMHPVMLLTFDDEIVLKAYCIRPVVTRLSQYTDQRVPDGTTMPRFAAADVGSHFSGAIRLFLYPMRTGKP